MSDSAPTNTPAGANPAPPDAPPSPSPAQPLPPLSPSTEVADSATVEVSSKKTAPSDSAPPPAAELTMGPAPTGAPAEAAPAPADVPPPVPVAPLAAPPATPLPPLSPSVEKTGMATMDMLGKEMDPSDPALLKMDYRVSFPNAQLSMHIENLCELTAPRYDPATGEKLHILFGVVTTKGAANEIQLAKLIKDIEDAGVSSHNYDAKSGTGLRITRLCVSDTRLLRFAEAIEFNRGLDSDATRDACVAAGLVIENPKTPEGNSWYEPYSHLSAPYVHAFAKLYVPLTEGERVKIARLLVTGDKHFKGDAKGCGLDIDKLQEEDDHSAETADVEAAKGGDVSAAAPSKFCEGIFPLHNMELKNALWVKWIPFKKPSGYDWAGVPVQDIMNYFGEEIGFYFGFLAHYVNGLTLMVPFALVAWIFSVIEASDGFGDRAPYYRSMYSCAFVAIFFTCGYSVILDSWKCEESTLAHLWHSYGSHTNLPPRSGFVGKVLMNPTSGNLEVDFPVDERGQRIRRTLAASGAMIFLLLVTTTLIFVWKASLTNDGASAGLLLVPSLLNAMQIFVFGEAYKMLADWLTDFENHRTVSEHNSALFRKLTLFYLLANFSAPLYIAFMKIGGERLGCADPITAEQSYTAINDDTLVYESGRACGLELSTNIAVLFITNDFFNRMATSLVFPRIARYQLEQTIKNDTTTNFSKMGPVEKQHRMLSNYDPTSELIMDYIELYVQWGYLTLFGASCPLVVLFAWITNMVETRTDGIKLLNDYRRVLPNRVDSVGEPLKIFYWTLYLAVPVNCGLIVFTFNAAAWAGSDAKEWVLLLILFFMVAFMIQLDAIYPDVSRKTSVQLKRQDVVYRRIILGEEPEESDLDFQLTADMVGVSIDDARKMATAKNADGKTIQDFSKMVVTAESQPVASDSDKSSNDGINPILGGN